MTCARCFRSCSHGVTFFCASVKTYTRSTRRRRLPYHVSCQACARAWSLLSAGRPPRPFRLPAACHFLFLPGSPPLALAAVGVSPAGAAPRAAQGRRATLDRLHLLLQPAGQLRPPSIPPHHAGAQLLDLRLLLLQASQGDIADVPRRPQALAAAFSDLVRTRCLLNEQKSYIIS